MAGFIIRRILWTIPVILLVILMIFVMMRQIEGNPFRRTERAVPPQVQANLERKFNLDKPVWQQYLLYVKGVFTLDLGPSLILRDRTVTDIVKEHFPSLIERGGCRVRVCGGRVGCVRTIGVPSRVGRPGVAARAG